MASSVGSGGAFISSEKVVTTAGTAVALAASADFWRAITIKAKNGNTGQVYVGGANVNSSTNDGLDAGESLSMETRSKIFDLALIFIDSDVSGEGVDFYAVKT